MRSQAFLFSTLLALAGGCHHSSHEPGDAGVDGGPPVPEATLVSPAGVAVGLLTDATNEHALYIANPTAGTGGTQSNPFGKAAHGQLHLVDASGNDAIVSSTSSTSDVAVGGYLFSPDGKSIVFGKLGPDGFMSNLVVAPVSAPTMGTIVVSTEALFGEFISQSGFFSSDGRYFIFGDGDQGLEGSQSMLVLDTQASPPAIVYEVQNGGFDGTQSIANGVLYYNTLSDSTTMPIITLYGVPLAGLTKTTTPKTIAERVSTFSTSTDGTALYYITGNGDVFSQAIDATGPKGTPTQITPVGTSTTGIPATPAATTFTLQTCSAEPCRLAWVSPDGALHVTVGTTEVYKTPASTVDLNSPVSFTNDGSVFFFQFVKSQESRGILYFADLSSLSKTPVAATTPSTPTAVFGTVTGLDDTSYDKTSTYLFSVISLGGSSLLAQQDLPPTTSAFGTIFAPLVVSGSPVVTLGMNVPSGDLLFGAANTLAFLSGAVMDKGSSRRINGGERYGGTLELASFTAAGKSVMATATDVVANGNYGFSDDNSDLLFIEQSVSSTGAFEFNKAGFEYAGTLHVYDIAGSTGDHPITIPGAASSDAVTQVGPIVSRGGFFIAAPVEAPAQGVYHLTY